jgi:two-component system sensor histidine kinase KdpD
VFCYDYFFVPPRFSFEVADIQYLITLGVMLIVGFVIGSLTGRLKQQAISMRLREKKTEALFRLSKDLSKTSVIDELFQIVAVHTKDFFNCPAVILSPDKDRMLRETFGDTQDMSIDANEQAVAQWAFEHKKTAGKNTDTLPASKGLYIPFVGSERIVGVLGVFPLEEKQFTDPDQMHMLEMFVTQTALAIEGAQLATEAIKTEAEIDNQRFRNMLLSTFSLDVSGPLKTIAQAVSELLQPQNINDESRRDKLLQKIRSEVEGLNNASAEMTRIILSEEKPT